MSDDHDDNAANALDGEEGSKKKSPMILIIGLLALLIAGGAGAYFMGLLDPLLGKTAEEVCTTDEHGVETCAPAPAASTDPKAAANGAAATAGQVCTKDEHGKEVCAAPGAQFLKIPEMIVNLNSDDGTPRYLRLEVQLEFKNAADMAAVEKVMPRVVDQFQTYLRELRVKDLRGSAGIYRLQMELLSRVNQASYPVEVQGVLFQEILIQ